MKARLVLVLLALACLAVFFVVRARQPSVASRRAAGHVVEPPARPMRQAPLRVDDAPAGVLRLEGQVIDEAERPVAGAEVALEGGGAVRTEPDGSFAFERLLGGAYRLEARTADGHAGPVEARLTRTSEPVILRLRRGGTLELEVRAAGTGAPVPEAEVELRSALVWKARTDAHGRATLRGVGPGWPVLHVAAAGFAPAALLLRTSGDPQRPQRQLMTLARGAAVSGVVLDGDGRPVAGARVIAVAAAEPFPVVDADRDGVTTEADGAWRFAALAAGTWRFVALHRAYAPGSTPPIALDGEHGRERIELRLAAGATLRGVVVDEQRRPVPGARVRAARVGAVVFSVDRETRSDDAGRFAIAALPAGPVDVSAAVEDAASALERVELGAAPREITLVLSLRDAIAGLAVAPDGKPVPEARLVAEPVWSGDTEEREAWLARGVPEIVADGGGRFRFAGLPAGAYLVRGARPGAGDDVLQMEKGTEAKTGATDLRVVVHGEGRVRGRVRRREGGAPELFSVEIGAARPEPFSLGDGGFELAAAGGTRELVVTGPTFQRASVPGVAIVEGETTDVGTIVVDAGRSVSGRVLDGSGRPVAGAQVAGGLLLTGDGGARLNIPSEGFRVQETESDANGRYALRGFGEHPITLVAGREGVGRANPLKLPRGPSSVEVDLVLRPTGSLAGAITRDGKPIADAVVIANPRGAISSNFFVTTGADGSYAFDMLSAGDWVVSPMLGGGGMRPKDMFFSAVTIVAGKQTRADVAVPDGPGSVEVSVLDARGAPVPLAQVLVVGGALSGDGVDPMDALVLPPTGQLVPLYYRMATGAPVHVAGLLPGPYTFCGVPLPADPNDPASMQAVRDIVYTLPRICTTATAGAPGQQIALRATAPSSTATAPSRR